MSRVRVNELLNTGGSIVNGFRFVSTVPRTQIYLSCNQCIADAISGGDAWLLQNVSDARLVNSWGANNAAASKEFAGIHLDNAAIVQISASDFRSHSRDVAITGNANLLSLVNNRFAGEVTNVYLDRVGSKMALMFLANRYDSAPTNDPAQLAGAAVLDPLSASGLTVWTRDDMGAAQTLRIVNQSEGGAHPSKQVRVNHAGQFEVLNDAGNVPLFAVDDDGTTFANRLVMNGGDVEAQIRELRDAIAALQAKIDQRRPPSPRK